MNSSSSARRRILIVGGYGIFGGRLVDLLGDDERLTVLVAGRSLEAAQRFCAARPAVAAKLVPVAFDRDAAEGSSWAALQPWLVVDASGPFQAYGESRYRLVEQCIRRGVPYLDLADGADFVQGLSRFDSDAKAAGIYVLSGVSSFPVLTAAVVRRLSESMARVETVTGGIAPSPYAGVGRNVIRAIASYAGQPMTGGTASGSVVHGFTGSRAFVIAAPGRLPLGRRRFSPVDVPDLRALPQVWPELLQVWMGAAPVPASLHAMLRAFAWLVRWKLLRTLSPLAPLMHAVTNRVRWGDHRGGMFVEVQGRDQAGSVVVRTWHMLAEGDDGPLIPCMAIEAIVRNALAGRMPVPGARAATGDVSLADYEALFARRAIHTGVRVRPPAASLYQHLLGSAWERLPLPVRQLHNAQALRVWQGDCDVERGRNPLALFVGACVGFPTAGSNQAITVTLWPSDGGEHWERCIGGRNFSSHQRAGVGRSQWHVCEAFGPVAVDMALVLVDGALHYIVRRWRLFGVPMPLWLGPRATAVERSSGDRFCFDVSVAHPFTGLIVRYAGWLKPASAALNPPLAPPSASAAAPATRPG